MEKLSKEWMDMKIPINISEIPDEFRIKKSGYRIFAEKNKDRYVSRGFWTSEALKMCAQEWKELGIIQKEKYENKAMKINKKKEKELYDMLK